MSKHTMLIVSVAAIALAADTGRFSLAQQASPEVLGELADNQGIFVDGKTFKIVRGAAKGDPTAEIAKMGAKEIGPGAILFRHGDKLYGVEGGAPEMSAQAMKNFQDNWNVSYMKAMTNFQDNWNVSFMKDFQDNWNVSFMKDKANEPYVSNEEFPRQLECVVHEGFPRQLECILHEEFPRQLECLIHEGFPG